jgi:hypothetical protein
MLAAVVAADPEAAAAPLIDLSSPQDLTQLAKQGKAVAEQQQQQPPPPAPTPWTSGTPGGSVTTPQAGQSGPSGPPQDFPLGQPEPGPTGLITRAAQDFKALGVGAGLAGVGVVVAVAFVFAVRRWRRLMRVEANVFTDLAAVRVAPAAAAGSGST